MTDEEFKGEEETLHEDTQNSKKGGENIIIDSGLKKLDKIVKCRNSNLTSIYVAFICV